MPDYRAPFLSFGKVPEGQDGKEIAWVWIPTFKGKSQLQG